MDARKVTNENDVTTFIMNELSQLKRKHAEKWLESFWQTEYYQALKQKLITQPELMSSEELICFVLTRDGGEMPYTIPLQRLKQAIEEKKAVLAPGTLSHLMIIQKVMTRDDMMNDNEEVINEFFSLQLNHYRNYGFLNFAKADLSNVNLKSFQIGLRNAYLVRANLSHAIFTGAHNVNLSFADLSYLQCKFPISKSNLSSCNLSYAKISAISSFENVDLTRADLTGTKIHVYNAKNINFQTALFNNTHFDYCKFKDNIEFFTHATSLEQLKAECISVMNAMLTCKTPSKEVHKKVCETYGRPDDINKREFDDEIYVTIAKDLVSKLEVIDNATLEEKIVFINSVYPYFEPKSKINNLDVAKGIITLLVNPDNFLDSTAGKDIGWARFFGQAEARTKSQDILYAAKTKMEKVDRELQQNDTYQSIPW